MDSSSNQWPAAERSGLNRRLDSVEKLIPVPLNGSDKKDGEFDLYYFVHTAMGEPTAKSVLFCAGGPGEIVRTVERANTYADFLSKYGYNVVFFHLRGTGFSQIPTGNDNDKFLRSTFAVQDMEAIRQDFLEKGFGSKNTPWEAIIGWSFGTVLAQLYAERYTRELVKKLVLISPLSRHMFSNSKSAYDDYYKEMLRIYRKTLDGIFKSSKEALANEFGDLAEDKDTILDNLFDFDNGILRKTEEAFGSIQSLIDAYSDIKTETFKQFELQKYSQRFYQSLRDIRIVGANEIDDSGKFIEKQRLIGKTLRDELIKTRGPQLRESAADNSDQGSQRAYYSFGIQDGLNWLFLREHCQRRHSVEDSIKAIGGKAGIDHTPLKKVKLDEPLDKTKWDAEKNITPWDPADHDHNVPTLILNGELDPVTAGGQAERYLVSKSGGDRTLIVFPSIGHAISLGAIFEKYDEDNQPPILSGAIRVNLEERIPPGKICEAKGTATGLELNPNLRLDLDEPEELKNTIKIHGCGIVRDEYLEKDKSLNIIALVENKSHTEIQVQDYDWCLHTPLLRGTVKFLEPRTIAAHDTCAIFGRLTHGEKNQEHGYEVKPIFPKEVDDGLELVGFNLKENGSLEPWFRNASGKTINPKVIPWTIQKANSRFGFRFRVRVPTLKKHEIISLVPPVAVDGLNFDPTELLAINPPKEAAKLAACFDPKAGNSDRLSLIVWNNGQRSKQIADGWSISCPVFSASIKLERTEIAPNSIKTVAADVTGIVWVKCLEIKEPPHQRDPNLKWDPNLRLLSFNIQERNSVSMLFKKIGDNPSVPACYDWKYVNPRVNGNDPVIASALNCLIFSFLVVSPSQFRTTKDNDILKRIQDNFNKSVARTLTILPPFKVKRRTVDHGLGQLRKDGGSPEALIDKSKASRLRRNRLWPEQILEEIRRLRTKHPNLSKEKLFPFVKSFCEQKKLNCPKPRTIGRLIADAPDKIRSRPMK